MEAGVALFPVSMRHLRRGRNRWGMEITIHPAVVVPAEGTRQERVAAATQACVDVLGAAVREHPEDWHMMQRVFVADLDPARLARAASATDAEDAA